MTTRIRRKEVTAKSILNRSKIPGTTYSLNPYIGCQHACRYCYARFMSRWSGHAGEEWGSFVDVKKNAVKVLEKQLWRKRKGERERVLLSSVTDAYQPLERKYEITKKCLELLSQYDFPISILTKSHLVTRDLDLLEGPENEVGVTVISLDEQVRRVFEHGAPNAERRLGALEEASEAGITTYGFIGPILPYISTSSMYELIERMASAGVSYILFDRMNIKSGIGPIVRKLLKEHFPDLAQEVLVALYDDDAYYMSVKEQIVDNCRSLGVRADIIF